MTASRAHHRQGATRPSDAKCLDSRLLAAHERADPAELYGLYRQAAKLMDCKGQPDAAGFFLTHAYIYALEAGVPAAGKLRDELEARGRL